MDDLDGVAQAEAVRRGDVSAAELAAVALARIAQVDPHLHAVVNTIDPGNRPLAVPDGILGGVPIALKDLAVRQRDVPIGLGVRALERAGVVAEEDSATGARWRAAGTVTVATTSTSPFGFGPWASTSSGSTRTPYDASRASNGSSGGSAALVAAGAVPIATSADAGGSTRLPAAWCGLVGLKPTRGLIPTDYLDPLVTEGVVTRTVRDTAVALDVLAGPLPGDVYTWPTPPTPFLHQLCEPAAPARVGIMHSFVPGTEAGVREAVSATARMLEDMGHHVEESQPLGLLEQPPTPEIAAVTFALLLDGIAQAEALLGRALGPDLEPYLAMMVGMGQGVSAVDRLRRDAWFQSSARRMLQWWDSYDVLVLPTCPFGPQPAEQWEPVPGDPAAVFERWGPSLTYTEPFNRSGQPAINLPLTVTDGLPVGVQLAGRPGADGLLLQLAAALEEVTGWAQRRPPDGFIRPHHGVDPPTTGAPA